MIVNLLIDDAAVIADIREPLGKESSPMRLSSSDHRRFSQLP